jgi:glyoxylase-like metal-dependent hydrolase (beta-lactamase superfamily II)
MTVLSATLLGRRKPTLLLPSHGQPMDDPAAALSLLADRMQAYVNSRRPFDWDLDARLVHPYARVTRHLLLNRSSIANSYVLLSETGDALMIDYGYDMTTGLPEGRDRASRRPWLASLDALRGGFGVRRVEVAVPTHYHDDHVAGLNLLREVEGTEIWIPANVAPILANPLRYDLPCQWYDPIHPDRLLGLGETVEWHEYAITVHELPGHTRYAVAFEFEVDGVTVLVTGDQQDGLGLGEGRREVLNYQYRNGFRIGDYRRSAALYRQVAPRLMVSGHWEPRWVHQGYVDLLSRQGEEVVALHHELLPLDELDLGADSLLASLTPYRSHLRPGETVVLTAEVRNPYRHRVPAVVSMAAPADWTVRPGVWRRELAGRETVQVPFVVRVSARPYRRARCAVDVSLGSLHLGQHAEALIDVRHPVSPETSDVPATR